MIEPITDRPTGDVAGKVVRVRLGGREYQLPVRSIRANREWKAQLDALTAAKVDAITRSDGAEGGQLEAIVHALEEDDIDKMLDLLISYDTAAILPSKAEIEDIEPDASMDIITACREVWRAGSPLADAILGSLETMIAERATAGSQPTSSPPPNTGGRRKKSKPN